ncbi:hypothetical protein GGF44_003539, partial [Coemansia sp. RSA 1694]
MSSPAALVHTGGRLQTGHPPARDGDELSQPLEPANVRAFWGSQAEENRQPPSSIGKNGLDVAELRSLLSTIIHKSAYKGAVKMGLYTQRCCDLYESLDANGRVAFLRLLSVEFCAPKGEAQALAGGYLESLAQSSDPAQSALMARALRDSLTPQYAELIDQINRLPGGFAFVVRMRADML